MHAVLLAAERGDDLRPLTMEIPDAMVPVLDRPVLAHTVDLLRRQGVDELVAALHHFPGTVRSYFGAELEYRRELVPLGTAGGVRNCRDLLGDETFLVVSGRAATDADVRALLAAHEAAGGVMTVTVERADRRGRVPVRLGDGGRVEALAGPTDFGLCHLFACEADVFDYFPRDDPADWVADVLPALVQNGAPVHGHELVGHWSDIASPAGLLRANFDVIEGRLALPVDGEELEHGLVLGEGSSLDGVAMVEPPVWVGAEVEIGEHARLQGPLVIGDGAAIGDGAQLRASVIFPGSIVPRETILIGAIAGHTGIVASLKRRS
jgi:mannose-1-phosphate guanylyltransferase/mannose-1-phosphate guanylyltransferase/phosphomannomutase